MFTGLIEGKGIITRVERIQGGMRLEVYAPEFGRDMAIGDSIAVDLPDPLEHAHRPPGVVGPVEEQEHVIALGHAGGARNDHVEATMASTEHPHLDAAARLTLVHGTDADNGDRLDSALDHLGADFHHASLDNELGAQPQAGHGESLENRRLGDRRDGHECRERERPRDASDRATGRRSTPAWSELPWCPWRGSQSPATRRARPGRKACTQARTGS